jgi:hypothetical protein
MYARHDARIQAPLGNVSGSRVGFDARSRVRTARVSSMSIRASNCSARHAVGGRVAVGLGILAEMVEAVVAVARAARRLGIDPVEVAHHRFHRTEHAVEVQAVETGFGSPFLDRLVVRAQRGHEIEHHLVGAVEASPRRTMRASPMRSINAS